MEQQALSVSNVNSEMPNCFMTSLTKWVLQLGMWIAFIAWIAIFFLVPTEFGRKLYEKWAAASAGSIFGETGSALLLYNGPLLIIACLAIPYLALNNRTQMTLKRFEGAQTPRLSLWTFPVSVDGPLGVVSAAELLVILVCVVFVLWSAYYYTVTNLDFLHEHADLTPGEKRVLLLEFTALCFGFIASSCLAFLFLPVARGSILVRLVGINFEHAIRYHIWLGHLTMLLLTLHGLLYMALWTIRGALLSSIIEWKASTGANFAGVISYTFGLLIWVTSLPTIRKRFFEVFYFNHQLYILFVIFFALHVGDYAFTKVVGGLFLFMLDRLLRFCQSRRNVSIISATSFPCGTVKLVISKPENLQSNALGLVFLKVGEISRLQWHPFSVSSGLLDGKQYLSVHIKAVGGWTLRLKEMISNVVMAQSRPTLPSDPCSTITASVEGPYGLEVAYYMRYNHLILVAGGSGISPFLGIVDDIYQQIKEGRACVPRHVLLVWAVKRSDELSLLSSLDIHKASSDELNIEIHAYITRESELLEDGKVKMVSKTCIISSSKRHNKSGLVGTADKVWPGTYTVVSSAGFVITLSLLDMYYINPFSITWRWYKGLLFLMCMVMSIFIFGGLVIGVWYLLKSSTVKKCEGNMEDIGLLQNVVTHEEELHHKTVASLSAIYYGRRPDFRDIFEGISKSWGESDICVIVCGTPSMESSVAQQCRSNNWRRTRDRPIFHFHTHTFYF